MYTPRSSGHRARAGTSGDPLSDGLMQTTQGVRELPGPVATAHAASTLNELAGRGSVTHTPGAGELDTL